MISEKILLFPAIQHFQINNSSYGYDWFNLPNITPGFYDLEIYDGATAQWLSLDSSSCALSRSAVIEANFPNKALWSSVILS